jgi:hypothetical protein
MRGRFQERSMISDVMEGMMNQRIAFDRGLLTGILIVIALDAVCWFTSTWKPATNSLQTVLVVLQAFVCIFGAVWLLPGRKRLSDKS